MGVGAWSMGKVMGVAMTAHVNINSIPIITSNNIKGNSPGKKPLVITETQHHTTIIHYHGDEEDT